jgi:phosphatidyl-myo-inositol dimannoside synthase
MILYVTRKFPPSVGGMETLAAEVWRALERRSDDHLIAHGGSNTTMPVWLPRAFTKAAAGLLRGRYELLLTGDAVMFMLLRPVARLARVPAHTLVMGLDLTWRCRAYQWALRRWLPAADRVIAISSATADVARTLGVPQARLRVVRPGVDAPAVSGASRAAARASLTAALGVDPERRLIVTLGRLVPRKGVRWFVASVLPRLAARPVLVIAGDGPDRHAIETAAAAAGVADRVALLGSVDESRREELLRGGDVFVQPNIRVGGDMEGFGVVTIESALRGVPVVAADLEGLSDAVVDGATGWLLPSGDAEAWVAALDRVLADPDALAEAGERCQAAALERFGSDTFSERLHAALASPC